MRGIFRSLGVYPDDCASCVSACMAPGEEAIAQVQQQNGQAAADSMRKSMEQACGISQCTYSCYASKEEALQKCYDRYGSIDFWENPLEKFRAAVEGLVCDSTVSDVMSAYGVPQGGRPGAPVNPDKPSSEEVATTIAPPPLDSTSPAPASSSSPSSSASMSSGDKIALAAIAIVGGYALWKAWK